MIVSIKNKKNHLNFYKTLNLKKRNLINKRLANSLTQLGTKALRFRKTKRLQGSSLFKQDVVSNQNIVRFKALFSKKTHKLGFWLKLENYESLLQRFITSYQHFLWGNSGVKTLGPKGLQVTYAIDKDKTTLLFSLTLLVRGFQFYLLKSFTNTYGGFCLSNNEKYWNYFPLLKTNLSKFQVGSMLHRGHSKNFYFSQVPNKSSWLLGKNDDFAKVLLPSKKVIFLNLHSTKASKANIVSDVLLLTPKHNKKSFYGRKPFVRGKAMNVFDHPNGGYKHSSKLLKTFKGKKIYK